MIQNKNANLTPTISSSSKCCLSLVYAREIRDRTRTYVELAREESQKAASRLFEQTKIDALHSSQLEAAKLLTEAQIAKQKALEDSGSEILHLVLEIVKELIAEIPLGYPETIAARIARALAKLQLSYQVAIKVNPGDLDYVKKWAREFAAKQPQIVLTVNENSSIERGDAILHTEYGQVHSSLAQHLQAISSAILPQTDG